MDFPHPPFVPTATTLPRLLWRWLDINAQGGPLGRVQSYITLPVFNVNYNWLGYSDIVASFNFEGPNNFSFKGILSEIPINPNYTLCVMWVDANMATHRYSLWRNPNDVIFFDITPYNGQLIGKNFRFEVWSVDEQAGASQGNTINFYTSKLGIIDYRYGTDFALVNADPIITAFGASLETIPPIPNDVNNGLTQHFISTVGVAGHNWSSQSDITVITSVNLVVDIVAYEGLIMTGVQATGATLTGAIGGGATPDISYIFLLFFPDGSSGNLVDYNGTPQITIAGANLSIGPDSVFLPSGTGKPTLLVVDCNNEIAYVIDMLTKTQITKNLTAGATGPSNLLTMLGGGITCSIVEMASYFNCSSTANVLNYFYAKYGGFELPLTFPVGAVPQPNSILN